MYFDNRLLTWFSTFLLIVTIAGIATAQDTSTGANRIVIEELIVTSQKRAESVGSIPISVTAITFSELDDSNIKNVAELSSLAPGLVVAKNEGFARAVAIRGIGFEATQNVSSIPSVAFHIDGVFIADPNALNMDFIDVERVEVLRGPQGTLFGQNSTGGNINVVNNRPDLDGVSGQVDMSVGNYGLVQPRGTVNIPLGETVALRASATYLKHDGFSEISSSTLAGYELDEEDNLQFQAKLLWEPTDEFSAILSATNFKIDNIHDRAQRNINDSSGDIRDLTQDTAGTFDVKTQLYSLTMELDTSFATIKSITGYVENDMANFLDNDRGADSFLGIGTQDISFSARATETLTQEVNLISNSDSNLEWIVGAFYMDAKNTVSFEEYIDFNGDGTADLTDPTELGFVVTTDAPRESWSLYGQSTYSLSESFRLTSGLRYTNDEFESSVCAYFCAAPSILAATESATTGKIGVEWDVNDDAMLYLSYTRGFKPGGNNLVFASVIVPRVYESESVDAIELGYKAHLLDDRLQLYAAAFYYQYDNMQFLTEDPAAFNGGVDNVPSAEVKGFEVELKTLLTDKLSIDASFSVLKTEITADKLALDPVVSAGLVGTIFGAGGNPFDPFEPIGVGIRTAATQNINGNPLPKAPSFSANISLAYDTEVSLGELSTRLGFTYRDEFASRVFRSGGALDNTPGYELLNLNIGLTPSFNPDLNFSLIVTNLTDDDAVNSRWTNNFGIQSTSDEFVAPRQVIGRISYKF